VPHDLGLTARVEQKPSFRTVKAANVAGMLRSTHPDHQDRYVIVSAHFDHLGKDPALEGDRIYNGAVDNCSATAAMVGTARHYVRAGEPVPFHLVFVGLTAEETGLLGSRYFAEHLPFPISATWANINHEMTNVWGRTKDVFVYGSRFSELTEVARGAARALGLEFLDRVVDAGGMSFRSDQLSFARAGIPAVWLHEGWVGADGKRDARKKRKWYLENRYHRVSDQVEEDWDLEGTLQMIEWTVAIVRALAQRTERPNMSPGSGMATAPALPVKLNLKVGPLPECDSPEAHIRRKLAQQRGMFKACYMRELKRNPKAKGMLLLDVVVAADGRPETLTFQKNTLNNAAVEDCIRKRVKRTRFPKCQGDSRHLSLPLQLLPP